MKVKDLINQLQECDQEQEVYIYIHYERYTPVLIVDELDDCVDVCADMEKEY